MDDHTTLARELLTSFRGPPGATPHHAQHNGLDCDELSCQLVTPDDAWDDASDEAQTRTTAPGPAAAPGPAPITLEMVKEMLEDGVIFVSHTCGACERLQKEGGKLLECWPQVDIDQASSDVVQFVISETQGLPALFRIGNVTVGTEPILEILRDRAEQSTMNCVLM